MDRIKGKKIGEGQSRIVYENMQDKSIVVKKQKLYPKLPSMFQRYMIDENYLEYLNYKNFCKLGLESWLSPCKYSHGDLIMQRATSLEKGKKYSVPFIFSNHYANWGIIDDKLVCIDYDFLLLPSYPIFKHKKKVIKSIFFEILVFDDSLKYIQKIFSKYKFKKPPFRYSLIKNKSSLTKLLKQTVEINYK